MKYRIMIVFPIAKINIGLHITAKRIDGYHDIETVFYPVGLCDALEFVVSPEPYKKDILTCTGINTGGQSEDNLILKTIRKLREKYSVPFLKIHLHKAIPVGAGLGGGSSDAASVLKSVNKLFRLNISVPELKAISLEIGSDCPFFIDGSPSLAYGRGEILKPIGDILSGYYIMLLNPGIGINTREAYQNCTPGLPAVSLSDLTGLPVTEWSKHIVNDFESYVFKKHPLIREIRNELYNSGAVFSLMSGSGSTVYGIFKTKKELPPEIKRYVIFEGVL